MNSADTKSPVKNDPDFFASVVENSQEAFLTWDFDGRLLTWNPAAEKIYGYPAAEAIGKHFSFIVLPANYVQMERVLRKTKEGVVTPYFETVRRRKHGQLVDIATTISPVRDKATGEIVAAASINVDITAKKRLDELESTNKQLVAAHAEALKTSQLKSFFIASVSHDLRTLLSGVIGMNELLLRTDLNSEQHEYAETVRQSAGSLLSVVNQILDLTALEAGKTRLHARTFAVEDLLSLIEKIFKPTAKDKGLSLEVKTDRCMPPLIIADADRITEVLQNLINNAIKFTQNGGIVVSAQPLVQSRSSCLLQFSVTDTGLGISSEDQRKLFEPYSQLDSPNAGKIGSGLGLAISKQLVQLMGGEIGVSSNGHGCEFWFTIPTVRQARTFAIETEAQSNEPKNLPTTLPVLVVEDNLMLQKLIALQLKTLGLEADVAKDGHEALLMADAHPYNVIFMDVHLPGMDGIQVTKSIRHIESLNHRHTIIIALTAGVLEHEVKSALSAGMDDFLSKPVSIDRLRGMLEKWCAA